MKTKKMMGNAVSAVAKGRSVEEKKPRTTFWTKRTWTSSVKLTRIAKRNRHKSQSTSASSAATERSAQPARREV